MRSPPATTVAMPSRPGRRGGFTLVELMVVMIILSILASLTLAGLAGARTRSKIDKTKSTIRKIHEIVIPHYESFAEKRVAGPLTLAGTGTPPANFGSYADVCIRLGDNAVYFKDKTGWVGPSNKSRETLARSRVYKLRMLQLLDLPDQWVDVVGGTSAAARRYLAFIQSQNAFAATNPTQTTWGDATPRDQFQSAECLALIATRGGFAVDATEQFRADEMGDVDGDRAPEFLDAWGRPILFIRWPSGYTALQGVTRTLLTGNADTDHDPFDAMKVFPAEYRLVPLIFSGGPDGGVVDPADPNTPDWYGLRATAAVIRKGWLPTTDGIGVESIARPESSVGLPGERYDPRAASDTITNHDLITK
jgi:prepilin-type N-terminal cleavage/methylation domain-containing protein